MGKVVEILTAIADCVDRRKPDADLMALLAQGRQLCEAAASDNTKDVATLAGNVRTILTTWQDVWPRLGSQPEFRQAVSREAGRWARQIPTMLRT